MNPLIMKGLAGLALAIALVAGYFAWESRIRGQGRASMKAEWDADNALRTKAENAAILHRLNSNDRIREQQEIDLNKMKKVNADEIAKIRAAYATDSRLRIPATVCSGFAASTEADRTGGGAAAPAGTVALSDKVESDLLALMQEADTIVAGCRAAQSFIRDNGLAP